MRTTSTINQLLIFFCFNISLNVILQKLFMELNALVIVFEDILFKINFKKYVNLTYILKEQIVMGETSSINMFEPNLEV